MAFSTELGNMCSAEVVAQRVVYLLALMLVQMLALLLAQMLVLIGLAGGVFEGCFFNRPKH
jgi:hypothetical protein